jgi:hypothetical protein
VRKEKAVTIFQMCVRVVFGHGFFNMVFLAKIAQIWIFSLFTLGSESVWQTYPLMMYAK